MMSQDQLSFLSTKISIPLLSHATIPRSRLVNQLEEGLRCCKLALVCAPAGYGKSTLVCQWLASSKIGFHVAWLTLNDMDNSTERLFAYLIAAFQSAIPGWGKAIQSWATLSELPPADIVGTAILEEMENSAPILLVLDDYHNIRNASIHQLVSFLLANARSSFRLVLLTREDPPVGIARLRAHGELLEIRPADLSFTEAECQQFLSERVSLLNQEQVRALHMRTEGWIAGLQLAAISLRSYSNVQSFIDQFRGSHRFIIDYLMEEVLRNQPPQVREFLARIAVLPRFCAALCEAILVETDWQAMPKTPGQILVDLERANLFIIPLDDRREWYRFHQLFADFLQTEVTEAIRHDDLIHAARWFLEAHLPEESLHCALLAKETALAADIIQSTAFDSQSWAAGYFNVILEWIHALPETEIVARPRLALLAARTWYLSGSTGKARKMLSYTQQFVKQDVLLATDGPEKQALLSEVILHQATFAGNEGQVEQAVELAHKALHLLPEPAWARAYHALAVACSLRGDFSQAEAALTECIQRSWPQGIAINAVGIRVQILLNQGEILHAEETARQALAACKEVGVPLPAAGSLYAALAEALLDQYCLAEAEASASTAIDLSRQGQIAETQRYAWWVLARAYLLQGGEVEGALLKAEGALRQLAVLTHSFGISRLQSQYEACQALLLLRQGRVDLALQWAERLRMGPSDPVIYDFEVLTLARVLLAANCASDAFALLEGLYRRTEQATRLRSQIEAGALLALAQKQQGHEKLAVQTLASAFRLAAPRKFARPFVETPSMTSLLRQVRDIGDGFLHPLFGNPPAKHPRPGNAPVDPLTPREMEVLRLIAEGLSNQEIAERLCFTPGTVKWYANQIYSKLGVENRARAAARARELGWV